MLFITQLAGAHLCRVKLNKISALIPHTVTTWTISKFRQLPHYSLFISIISSLFIIHYSASTPDIICSPDIRGRNLRGWSETEDAFIIMSSVIELSKNFQWVRFRSIAERNRAYNIYWNLWRQKRDWHDLGLYFFNWSYSMSKEKKENRNQIP